MGAPDSSVPPPLADSNPRSAGSGTKLGLAPPGSDPRRTRDGLEARLQGVRLSPGQVVPGTRYRLDRWLGEGAMGVVYSATHLEIGRRAALKVLSADFSKNPAAVQAFRDEARASATIGNPNIVEVYDFTTLADGRLVMAMELLDGRSLDSVLRDEGKLESSRVIGILRQVCKGLLAAHRVGIVHRDVKPENVMLVTREGRPDFVKLLDFGISSVLGQRTGRTGVGTPLYMAPETIVDGPVDDRADIYSLGCTAYELVTGRPPFVADNVPTVLRLQLDGDVVPPRKRGAEIPKALEEVIVRCLEKRPDDRFDDMADLEAALCEAQISARLQSTWDDLPLPEVAPARRDRLLRDMPEGRGRRRTRGRLIGAAVAVVATAIATALTMWVLAPPPEVQAIVVRDDQATSSPQHREVSRIDRIAAAAEDAAARALYVYPPVDTPDMETSYRLVLKLEALTGDDANQGEARAADLRAQYAETLARLGDQYWERPGGIPFAMDYYIQALLFTPEHAHASSRVTMTPGELSNLRDKAGRGGFTLDELHALEPLQVLAGPDEETRKKGLARLRKKRRGHVAASAEANLDLLVGDAPASGEDIETDGGGLDTSDALDPDAPDAPDTPDDPVRAAELSSQAAQAAAAGRLKSAERLFHQALRAERGHFAALVGLGDLHFERSQYSQSAKYRRMAVRAHPRDAGLRLALGDSYFKSLRYEDALVHYRKAEQLGSADAAARVAKVESRTR